MTVQLTSLRVSADFDASKYVAGLAKKDAAEARSAASSKRVEVSVLSAKKRMEDMGVSATRLARDTIAGYRDTERFSRGVLNLGRALAMGQFSADQAAASLDGLYRKYGLTANAAELAAAGHHDLATAVARANAAIAAQQTALAGQESQLDQTARSAQRLAANQNNRMVGGSFSGLAAQFQDIGVTAAMGMSPVLIALQQGTQIAGQMEATLDRGGKAIHVFGQAFRSLLSPLSLAAIGLTGLAAAGLQLVDWTGLAVSALNGFADILPTIAPYAAAAAAGLALLYAPAILGGITLLSEMILGLTARLAGLAIGFALANPVGAFVAGFAIVATAATIFRDELARILGVDIVGYAKDGVNAIIGAFVGAYAAIKASWAMLPSAIGDLVITATNATISAVERMLNFIIEKIDTFVGKIEGVIATVSGWMGQDGVELGRIGGVTLGRVSNPYAGAAAAAGGVAQAAYQGEQGVDYAGNFAGAVTSMASGAADSIRALAAGLDDVDDKAKKAGGSLRKAADKDPWDGLTKSLQQAAEFMRDLTGGIINDLRSGLQEGKSLWQAFGTAASNALTKITDKLLNEVLDALFQVNGAGGAGGGGGILGTLFGGLLGGGGGDPWAGMRTVTANANGNAISSGNVIPFARGGVVTRPTLFPMASGAGLMGEVGPEAVMPLRRLPSGRLGVEAGNTGSAAQGGPLVNVQVINNASNTRVREDRRAGPDGREMRRIIIEEVKGEMASGGFDGVMGGRYGASAQRVAR